MSGSPTLRTELENIRAAHIEAEQLIRVVLLRSAMTTPNERRNVEALLEALTALQRGKAHICALHIDSTEQNDIAIE